MTRKMIRLFMLGVILLAHNKIALAQNPPLSLQQIVAASGFIFSGKVVKVWSERDSATGFIVTCSTIAVQDAIRGVSHNQFTFKQYGGSYAGLNVFLADMSYFFEGEEIVAFLYPLSALGLTSPLGTVEGKFVIRRDPATGKKMVFGNLLHAKMPAPLVGKSAPEAIISTPVAVMEYDKFIAIVRDLVHRSLSQ